MLYTKGETTQREPTKRERVLVQNHPVQIHDRRKNTRIH